jgi:7,8-dihydroneopterin aldolase/epimerase/oxygenase
LLKGCLPPKPEPRSAALSANPSASFSALARSAALAEPMDIVFIEGFVASTVIGIHQSELHEPQPVRVDLQAGLPRSRACDTDRIVDTIDYAVVRERLLALFAQHRVQLLEALAEAIAQIVVCEFGAQWVRVAVAKPKKFGDLDAVGVAIERHAGDFDALRFRQRVARMLTVIGEGMVPGRA